MISVQFYWIFLSLCAAYVFVKGGPPERLAIAIMIVGSFLTLVVEPQIPGRYRNVQMGVFAVDVICLFAFGAVALAVDRFWPLWITGIHLIGVATHTAKLVQPEVVPWVYGATQALWSYPMIILIVIGAVRHQKRLRRYGADSSWNGFFVRLGPTTLRAGPNA